MHLLSAIRRNRAAVASGATLTVAAVTVSTLAFLYEGIATADLALDDGGVWVTKSSDLLVGRVNYPSRLLDEAVRTRTPDFDILQRDSTVLVHDRANSTLATIDPATALLGTETALPAGSAVALGGRTVAVLGDGFLHALEVSAVPGATLNEEDALLELDANGAIAVAHDGSAVFGISSDGALHTIPMSGTSGSTTQVEGISEQPELSMTAVGQEAVALDAESGQLWLAGGRQLDVSRFGRDLLLQQPGASADSVYLATRTALIRQPLDGSAASVVAEVTDGDPAPPVWLSGCAYAVWGGSGEYVRDCPSDADDSRVVIDAPSSASLVLRTNRRVVVVNDTTAGTVWVVADEVDRVDNWDDVVPPPDETAEEEESEEQEPQFDLPERSAQNNPPTAVDDEYGIRAGRTTLIRVTDNDTDPDGDLLSVALTQAPPEGFSIEPVLGGAALQVVVNANASGTVTVPYRAEDGRGGADDAVARLTVRTPEENGAPQQRRVTTVRVEAGSTLSYNALEGWTDPDGDDVYLVNAALDGPDTVAFRSNGIIEFTSTSPELGTREVSLTVSDGREESQGVLIVDVRAPGTLSPIANADRVVATAGVPVTVSPLANDVSPTGEPLRLARHDSVAGARITPDFAGGSFEFVAEAPGTFYVQYLVTDGPRSSVGIIRVDVLPDGGSGLPPVAVRDVALLPSGRDVLVDVLANDTDPSGGILVVQSARSQGGGGVIVEVLEHRVLRITDATGLSAPVVVVYTVSNGAQTSIGEVLVLPVPLPTTLRPPVAVPDSAVVRTGDVVTIPVLANDYHPDNDLIELRGQIVETTASDPTSVFVDGSAVRFHAGSETGSVAATYEIEDSQGNRTAGYITIQVIAAADSGNSAPRPRAVIARAIAGNTVRIALPLDGIDPDGDSVALIGTTSNPSLGSVTVGDSWVTYRAYPTSQGTDTFTYAVRDRLGAVAEATVTVGVAAPGAENQPPYAVKDVVAVRPGRDVSIAVTANDSDPDGDEIAIDADGLEAPEGLIANVVSGRVLVTAPQEEGTSTISYGISDAFGAQSTGAIVLEVSEGSPLQAPIARDDRLSPLAMGDRSTATVAVLENDEDIDGTAESLRVDIVDGQATVRPDGVVEVELLAADQIIRYAVTDRDGLVGQAFIFVPALSSLEPTLITEEPIEVRSGETVVIALADHVAVRSGTTPRVSVAESLAANHSNGASLLRDEATLEYTSAEGYFGPDSIGVLVTDGAGPDDPDGRQAYISIPLLVVPVDNQSPILRNAAVAVAPDEEPVRLDLRRLAIDADAGDLDRLRFSLDGAVPAELAADINGSELRVSALAAAEPGTTAIVTYLADDGSSEPGRGVITVSIVATQRPLPIANDDVIERANQGEPRVVAVLENDINPFEDESLRIVSARVDSGTGTAAVVGDGVEVTPASDFTGTLLVTYRIADATLAPERQVEARIILTVQGRPDAPTTPVVTAIQDRTVVLTWTPPNNNGAPIQGYRVESSRGDVRDCPASTCTIDQLTNDVEYTFEVIAINEVGESERSPASAVARPDARPDAPAPPALEFGDGSLTVNWATPRSAGSPVQSYNLEISPAPATGAIQRTGVTGTSLIWDGLQNGVAYQVRVQAVNRAPDPSEWSPYSATMIPAGVPDTPAQPSASSVPSVGSQSQIEVSWTPPADNGDAISQYIVTASGGGAANQVLTVPGTSTSATFTVGTSTSGYAFTVAAVNKAGQSGTSPSSNTVRAANAPGAPASVTIEATGTAGQVRVAIVPGAWNGNAPSEVTWQSSRGTLQVQSQSLTSVTGTISGIPNGQVQTLDVWGVSGIGGQGPATTSNAAKPWGPLRPYTPTATRSGDRIVFSWNVTDALNGQELSSLTYSASGGQSGSGGVTGSATSGAGYYTDRTFTMTMTTVEGNSATYTASANTGINPNRSADMYRGAQVFNAQCTASAPCYYYGMYVTGVKPGEAVRLDCYNSTGTWTNTTRSADGSGNLRVQDYCFSGLAANNVWDTPYYFIAYPLESGGSIRSDNDGW